MNISITYNPNFTAQNPDGTFYFPASKTDTSSDVESTALLAPDNSALDFYADGYRAGYVFLEWNTASNGSGTSYQPGDLVTENLTLYAIWLNPKYIARSSELTAIADAIRTVLGPTPKGKNLYDPVLKKARLTPGETYTVSMDITWDGTHSSAVSHYLRYKNSSSLIHEQNRIVLEGAPEAGTTSRHSYQVALTSEDVREIRNIYEGYEDTITIANIQVELGSTATAYEAYDGHILFPTGFENLIQNDLVQKILNGVYTLH